MARQNTFTVIPPAPRFDADTAAPARPMTSKQVRKAYKAATKTPTMTRAERIKWEREEQERIKKEFEKEKAAAKARAVREKKKEKEMQQREEKRRNGLPLVNVRPSQDTIARFVRGNGSKKKRDAEGKAVTTTGAVPLDEPEEKQCANATALGSITEAEEWHDGYMISEDITSDRPPPASIDNKTIEHNMGTDDAQAPICNERVDEKIIKQGMDLISEDYDIDLSLEEPFYEASYDAALDLVSRAQLPKVSGADTRARPIQIPPAQKPADDMKYQVEQSETKDTNSMSSQDLLDEEINTDMLEELDELLSGGKTPAKSQIVGIPCSDRRTTTITPVRGISPREPRNTAGHESPSPLLGKWKSAPRRKLQISQSSSELPRQAPPLGTQAILFNVDDFFPTSSQQLRELLDEQEPGQGEASPQTPLHKIQQHTTRDANIQPQSGARQRTAAKLEVGIDGFESESGSFPSTAQPSLLECSLTSQKPHRHTPQIYTSTPAHRPEPVAQHPPQPQPSRFFTSSGSREQLSLVLQRSRRSAALEQIQEKERQRQEAGLVMRQSKCDEAHRPASPTRPCNAPDQGAHLDKENVPPQEMRCSQETEYGGDWVEDAAWDLALC